MLLRFVPDRWWRRPPFLPIPSKEYRAFRLAVMGRVPTPTEVVDYLDWCRRCPRCE